MGQLEFRLAGKFSLVLMPYTAEKLLDGIIREPGPPA
jgi:hypothetical protein